MYIAFDINVMNHFVKKTLVYGVTEKLRDSYSLKQFFSYN